MNSNYSWWIEIDEETLLPKNSTNMTVYSAVQMCPTLCDPMDCSPPGSSVHGIFQARILKWVAISFCRGSSRPRDQTCISWVSCLGRQILYHCTWEANITEKHFISQGKKKIYYLDTLLSKQTAPNMSLPNKGWWLKLKMGKTERKYWKFSCFAFHNPSHGEGCGSSGRQEEVNLVQLDWLQVGGI